MHNAAMKVLVTGAAGTLGTAVIPRLTERGDHVVALDVHHGTPDAAWVIGDIRDRAVVMQAAAGTDLIVHGAAFHGIHLSELSRTEFYELNVLGTFNVWEAAAQHGVSGMVFSSTMGVYGDSRLALTDDAVAILEEDVPLLPVDVYGWTKVVGEELCRFHARASAIPSIALRYGMFVPEPFFRYGIRLLYGGVHEADVADVVVAALDSLGAGRKGFDAFNVESPLPFTEDDAADLRRDPMRALDRHWPGSADLLRSRGVHALTPVTEVFPVTRLERQLGVHLRRDFSAWLQELQHRPDERAGASPPWP
jgi:nucleoside-diphosphate-sugar epimerase